MKGYIFLKSFIPILGESKILFFLYTDNKNIQVKHKNNITGIIIIVRIEKNFL